MSQAEEELEATVAARRDWVESDGVLWCSRRCQISLLPLNSLFQCLGLLCEFEFSPPSLIVALSLCGGVSSDGFGWSGKWVESCCCE